MAIFLFSILFLFLKYAFRTLLYNSAVNIRSACVCMLTFLSCFMIFKNTQLCKLLLIEITTNHICFPDSSVGKESTCSAASWCKELIHLKRPWCWERLKAGGEGDNRGWDGWMVSLTKWTYVWVSSGSWWWTGRPGMLQSMGSQRVGHDWATELNWTNLIIQW